MGLLNPKIDDFRGKLHRNRKFGNYLSAAVGADIVLPAPTAASSSSSNGHLNSR